jgi:hypothetical protein
MTDKDKKIFKISAYVIGGMLVFFAIKTIAQIRAKKKAESEGSGDGDGTTPEIQPTISRQQALGIAEELFTQIDGANVFSGVDDSIEILSPIQNIEDWKLIKTAYGVRFKENFGPLNNFTGDLIGALRDEYKGDDLQKIRNFFNNKGINTGI